MITNRVLIETDADLEPGQNRNDNNGNKVTQRAYIEYIQ